MSSAPLPAIEVRGLGKRYRLEQAGGGSLLPSLRRRGSRRTTHAEDFWALRGVTFSVRPGERVAVIGANGAGKSTLLKILSRIAAPTEGEAKLRGRAAALLELGVGFKDALTGRENVFLHASLHGLARAETRRLFPAILDFSELDPRFLDVRVKHYSSGMRMRLAYSVAVHLRPDILLLDEIVSVGDLGFQGKCLSRVASLLEEGRTLLLVSHSPSSVLRLCERAIWLDAGRVVLDAPAEEAVEAYRTHMAKLHTRLEWRREPAAGEETAAAAPPRTGATAAAAAELVSMRAIGEDGESLRLARVNQPIGVEVVFDVLADDQLVLPSASFTNEEGLVLFLAVYTDPEHLAAPPRRGRFASTLWLPPHLFNVGLVHVSVSLTTPASRGSRRQFVRHARVERALTFQVLEAPAETPSARGPYREVGGALRPLCRWEMRLQSVATT